MLNIACYIPFRVTHETLRDIQILKQVVTQYCAGGEMENNEMGVACGAYGGGERGAQGVGGET
jgi:hypothetical protein